MDNLLNPDTGLMVWTITTFLVLVFVLGKFAWKPMVQTLNDREAGIRKAIDDAQAARSAAEQLKAQYEKELAQGQEKVQALLARTAADAQKIRETLLKDAEAEAQRLAAASRAQIEEEKNRVMRDLRKEVAHLSVLAAEKLVRHTVNPKVQDEILQDFFKDLEKQKGKDQLH
jgi:F-type H+-transporting ATPase subunit b